MSKRLPGDRAKLRRSLSEANPLGKRLKWVREKLKLTQSEVVNATNIPGGCYSDRENGRRTTFYEEILVLALYFNRFWAPKYKNSASVPEFEQTPVKRISVAWLLFGKEDPSLTEAKQLMRNIEENYRRKELEMLEKQKELERQLEMFKLGEN